MLDVHTTPAWTRRAIHTRVNGEVGGLETREHVHFVCRGGSRRQSNESRGCKSGQHDGKVCLVVQVCFTNCHVVLWHMCECAAGWVRVV
jgi:hypothetical protein